MISMLRSFVIRICSALPNRRGILFLLRIQANVNGMIFSAIKKNEKKSGRFHPKHWVTDFYSFFLDEIKETDSVLEVGCSVGYVAHSLSQKAKHVIAIDLRPDVIQKARDQFKRDNLEFQVCNAFNFNNDDHFDVVVLSNVLEHIDDRILFLERIRKLGDKYLIRVPAFDRDWMVAYRKECGIEYRLNTDHRLEYTEAILREELESAGYFISSVTCKWGNYCCVALPKAG